MSSWKRARLSQYLNPSHVIYKGTCNCGQTYIGETARNLEIRVNEHSDVNGQSEPAKHIKEQPNHKFSWEVLTTAHSWMNRRIKEALYIARFRPELNKQVQSFDLTLFPMVPSAYITQQSTRNKLFISFIKCIVNCARSY